MNRFTRVVAGMAALCCLAGIAGEDPYRYIRIPADALTRDFVGKTGFIRDHVWDDAYAFGYVPKTVALDGQVSRNVVELDAWEWATRRHDPKTLREIPEKMDAVGPYEDYHTYETLTTELKSLADTHPQLAKLHTAGKSVQGRELWYLRITGPGPVDSAKPKLLYISSMHGDEVTGKEMMVYLIRDLLGRYGTDSRLTALVDNAELFILPSMNPDGTEKRQRWNANGSDLNRNFPNSFEGVTPLEAPQVETLRLMELQKQHHFVATLNFHGGIVCFNLPWDHKANPAHDRFGDDAVMVRLAKEYAKNNATMWAFHSGSFVNGITYGYEWYQVLGGMQDWSIANNQATHGTLEISETKWPAASQLPHFWSENRESLLRYLEGGIDGIHLKVTGPKGRVLPSVEVEVDTAKRILRFPDGIVHRATVPGTQKVVVRAAGHQAKTIEVPAEVFSGKYRVVELNAL